MTGLIYGLLLGVTFAVLDRLNSPIAWASYWALQALLLGVTAKLTWQRSRLFWLTATGAYAAVVSLIWVPVSLAGFTIGNLTYPWNVVFWVSALMCPLLLLISRIAHGDQLRAWEEQHPDPTLRDMLMFRHIPDLRSPKGHAR